MLITTGRRRTEVRGSRVGIAVVVFCAAAGLGNGPRYIRSASRTRSTADYRGVNFGFRLARSLP